MSLDTEFDPSEGLISPDYEKLDLQLPERAVYAFLSEARIGSYIEIRGGKLIGHLPTTMKNIPIWIVNDDGEDVAVMEASLGAPASVITQERLFAYGVEKMLMISCCGTLVDMPENTFLPVERAYRDEGTSAHYMPASHFIELDPKPLSKIEALFMDLGISVEPCTTWTTDAFFRETRNKVEMRKAGAALHPARCGPDPERQYRPAVRHPPGLGGTAKLFAVCGHRPSDCERNAPTARCSGGAAVPV